MTVPDDLADKTIEDAQSTPCHDGRVLEQDIYLYPTGMSAIYNAHRTLLAAKGNLKSVSYG